MAAIKVLAGDFTKKDAYFKNHKFEFTGETVSISKIKTLEVASEENIKRVGGTVGWGVAGTIALGGIGLLAGLVLGGKGKEISFVAQFKDGRRLLATTDSKTYSIINAEFFDTHNQSTIKQTSSIPLKVPDSVKNSSNAGFDHSNLNLLPDEKPPFAAKAKRTLIFLLKITFIIIGFVLALPLFL
jgi:hypothetical protein